MGELRWERLASVAICAAALGGLFYLLLRYALGPILPFLVAYLLSLVIRPMARGLARRTHLSQKLCAGCLLVLLLIGLSAFVWGVSRRLILELEHLLVRLSAGGVPTEPIDLFEELTSRIGFLQRIGAGERFSAFRESFNTLVEKLLTGAVESLTAGIPRVLRWLVSTLPSALFTVLVTLIATLYFCLDGERIQAAAVSLLPRGIRTRLSGIRTRVRSVSLRYLRSYLLLLLLTFVELFCGFWLLGVDYALLLALLISAIDLLPILGVGTVLIPWALVLLLMRRLGLGLGLLLLYLAVTVLRQILEPRLVGRSLGLHPLLALAATYVGWQTLGLLGLMLGPILALLIKAALSKVRPKISD